jgi:hypothetical protein
LKVFYKNEELIFFEFCFFVSGQFLYNRKNEAKVGINVKDEVVGLMKGVGVSKN